MILHRKILATLVILFLVASATGFLETIQPKVNQAEANPPGPSIAAADPILSEKNKQEDTEEESSLQQSGETYVVTAYDLSEQSCDTPPGNSNYGLTASGVSLAGETWQSARAVAVDPEKIPLGTKLLISFDNSRMEKYNGVYTAVDTGGAVTGNHIDFFYGDYGSNTPDEVWEFGRQTATVIILT